MRVTNITWKIGGEAGYGILKTGNIFSSSFSKKGYSVIDHIEYPSLIRGGHNTYISRINSGDIFSLNKDINILVALNRETIELHQDEITYSGYIIYDGEKYKLRKSKNTRKDINYVDIPFQQIASEQGLSEVMINSMALGASMALINHELQVVIDILKDVLGARVLKLLK